MLSSSGATQTFVAPKLSEEDVFNSQPLLGAISYRLPSLHVLVGSPAFDLYHYDYVDFELRLIVDSNTIECPTYTDCRIRYRRDYTPIVKRLNPPVVYYESIVEWIIDPK